MKTKFNNRECTHVWASQNKTHGKGASIFFEGPSIYSYGKHFEMARIVKNNVVLITTDSYSVTTSKHMSYVWRAVRHMTAFRVPSIDYHPDNLRYLLKDCIDSIESAKRARVHIGLKTIRRKLETLQNYVREFPDAYKKLGDKKIRAQYRQAIKGLLFPETLANELQEKADKADRQREERYRLEKEKRKIEEREELEKWKLGQPTRFHYFAETALRVKDGNVQTTHNANVPIHQAKKLYKAIKLGVDVRGMRCGLYVVNHVSADLLVIGCHNIPMSDVERIAPEVLAYVKPAPTVCEHCLGIDGHEVNCFASTPSEL